MSVRVMIFIIVILTESLTPKKVILFPKIVWVKIFLSPTCPHKSNVYENICFLFQKTHTQTKKVPLANLFVRIYVFFPSSNNR